jgi:hypothetical protein
MFQAVEQQLCWKDVFDELLKAKKAYRQAKAKAKTALPSGIRWPSGCRGGRDAASKSGVNRYSSRDHQRQQQQQQGQGPVQSRAESEQQQRPQKQLFCRRQQQQQQRRPGCRWFCA